MGNIYVILYITFTYKQYRGIGKYEWEKEYHLIKYGYRAMERVQDYLYKEW